MNNIKIGRDKIREIEKNENGEWRMIYVRIKSM